MKMKTIALFLVLTVSLAGLLQAKTLKFPKNNPQFSVTFTSDWKAEITDAGIISAQPKGAAYAISIFRVQATTASGAMEETLKEADKGFTDVKPGEPGGSTNDTGLKFLERDFTGKEKDAPRPHSIVC